MIGTRDFAPLPKFLFGAAIEGSGISQLEFASADHKKVANYHRR